MEVVDAYNLVPKDGQRSTGLFTEVDFINQAKPKLFQRT